MVFVDRYY